MKVRMVLTIHHYFQYLLILSINSSSRRSIKQILIKNHTEDNQRLIRGHLPLEYTFAFCKSI